ncbi:conserved hypothetical protein [Vibrio chagasii]|nr:conserved hypothetical protein [Vibrio chagasii]
MKLLIENKYLKHLSSLKTDADKKKFVSKITSDANQELEQAVVAKCILRLEGEHMELNRTDSLKQLDAVIKDKRSVQAALTLGLIYKYGFYEQRKDAYKADEYLRLAATQGDSSASFELGLMYLEQGDLKTDIHEAMRWIEQASGKGSSKAMVIYGTSLLKGGAGAFGDLVELDTPKALKLLNIAAEKGESEAKEMLAKYHAMTALKIAMEVSEDDSSADTKVIKKALIDIEWSLV